MKICFWRFRVVDTNFSSPSVQGRAVRAPSSPPGMSRDDYDDVQFTTLVREEEVSSSGMPSTIEPEDTHNIAYWSCFILGGGLLFPWNAYISAVDYFGELYPDEHVDRAFGVLYFLPNLAALCGVLRWGNTVEARHRIRFGYLAFLFCLVVPAASTSLIATYVAVALTGVADAICQGSLFGTIAPMPEKFTQALMGGTSFSGLVVSALRLITKGIFSQTKEGKRRGAVAYFMVSAAWVSICLVLFTRLEKTPVYVYHHRNEVYSNTENDDEYEADQAPVRSSENHSHNKILDKRKFTSIVRSIWPHVCTVFSVYAVTLSIFPGVLAEDVRNESLGDWYPVLLITCFNAFDVLGKMLPRWWVWGSSILGEKPKTLAVASVLRVLFVPAFLFVSKENAPLACTVLVASLGLTNGWYSSVGMMTAPKTFVENGDQEICGTVMVFFLLGGLATGAACGWLWV